MANVQRYRRGPQRIVKGTIQAGKKVEIGDLVAVVGSYVVNAEASTLITLANFKAGFAGVLIEGATAGTETVNTPCLVGITGVYEFDVAAALGAALVAGKAIGGVLIAGPLVADQVVAGVADRTTAIAVLAEDAPAGSTTLMIEIHPAVFENTLA